jgi:flagellar biosynthesis/type III secretory pathway M-ring protein FliF/YscJ
MTLNQHKYIDNINNVIVNFWRIRYSRIIERLYLKHKMLALIIIDYSIIFYILLMYMFLISIILYNILQNYISRDEENEGLPKGTRQLKLPPDKHGSSNKPLNHNRTTRIKLDCKSLNFVPICEVTGTHNKF